MNQASIPNFVIYSTKSTFGSTFGLEIASGPNDLWLQLRGSILQFFTFRHVILYYFILCSHNFRAELILKNTYQVSVILFTSKIY